MGNRNSQFAIRNSQFAIRHSQFAIRKWIVGVLSAIGMLVVLFSGCEGTGRVPGIKALGDGFWEALGEIGGEKDGMLVASGTIQSDEIRLASELGGRILEVRAGKGERVRAGDVLVVLDDTSLRAELAEAEAAVAVAQADLAVVKAGPRTEEIAAARAALALARARRDGAHAAWQNALQAVANPQELDAQIIQARTQVKLAEQGVIQAQAELDREKLLRDQKRKGSFERDMADLQVKGAEEKLAAARADYAAAQALLDGLQHIRGQPLGLIAQAHAAEGQVGIAEAGVAVAQAQLDDLLAGPTTEEIAIAEGAVRLARAQAGVLRAQQRKLTLASPVGGVVLSQALQEGEIAAPAATILTLADLGEGTLVVYVPVNQIGQVQLGQEVQVTVDSFPGQRFPGQVSHIGNEPEFTPRNVATREERLNTFYAVEIRLPNAAGMLKPGMPADATFGLEAQEQG
jgi:HlyD family secretion protein